MQGVRKLGTIKSPKMTVVFDKVSMTNFRNRTFYRITEMGLFEVNSHYIGKCSPCMNANVPTGFHYETTVIFLWFLACFYRNMFAFIS